MAHAPMNQMVSKSANYDFGRKRMEAATKHHTRLRALKRNVYSRRGRSTSFLILASENGLPREATKQLNRGPGRPQRPT